MLITIVRGKSIYSPPSLRADEYSRAQFAEYEFCELDYELIKKEEIFDLEEAIRNNLNKYDIEETNEIFTHHKNIQTLRDMNFKRIPYEGYEPLYEQTALTDAMH